MKWGQTKKEKKWTEVKFAWLPTKMSDGYWIWLELYHQDYEQVYGTLSSRWRIYDRRKWQPNLNF